MKQLAFILLVIVAVSLQTQAKYSGGSGTAEDPYQIANADDLLAFAADTNDYDANFIMTADINLGSYIFTAAVVAPDLNNSGYDFEGTAFTGIFNGAGHKITNLTIDTNGIGNDYLGLFGQSNGAGIKNLGIENVSITGGDYSYYLGGLAGEADNISNCYSTGTVIGGNDSYSLGGLVGTNYGSFNDCYSTATVVGGNGSYFLGGLVGGSTNISNCHATGDVIGGYGSWDIGGLAGVGQGAISGCYSTGAVTGADSAGKLGGLVGEIYYIGAISNCYSTGNVTGGLCIGGLVGFNESDISNCYSTGEVNCSGEDVGGLVGFNFCGGISNCCFLISSGPDNGIGTPLTGEEMRQQSSFTGWDFIETWGIEDNQTYPFLKPTYSVSDLNRDKSIDFFDFAILASHWLEGH